MALLAGDFGGVTAVGRTCAQAANRMPYGLTSGMRVMTLDGELPVDHLVTGDRIVTRRAGSTRLTGHRIDRMRLPTVEIRGGALGHMDPDAILTLPAGQMILLRDWRARVMFGQPQVAVPVGLLVDHGLIRDLGEVDLVLHRLEFDRAEVVYAEGLELLSAPPREALRPAA